MVRAVRVEVSSLIAYTLNNENLVCVSSRRSAFCEPRHSALGMVRAGRPNIALPEREIS